MSDFYPIFSDRDFETKSTICPMVMRLTLGMPSENAIVAVILTPEGLVLHANHAAMKHIHVHETSFSDRFAVERWVVPNGAPPEPK